MQRKLPPRRGTVSWFIPWPYAPPEFIAFLDEGVRHAHHAHIKIATHGKYDQQYRDYLHLCVTCRESPAFTFRTVSRYLFLCFIVPTSRKARPSASTIPGRLTALRKTAESSFGAIPWVPVRDIVPLRELAKGLQALDTDGSTKAFALVLAVIVPMLPTGQSISLHLLQWATITLIMHWAMLRMDDIAKGKLRKDSVHWYSDGSFTIMIPPGKSHAVHVPAHFPMDSPAATWFRSYWAALDMESQPMPALLFPEITPHDIISRATSFSSAEWVTLTRHRAASIGIIHSATCPLTGHSCRSGGCTDFILAGVPHAWIQQLGRWSSDAYLDYFRLTAHSLAIQSSQMFGAVLRHLAA